MKAFDFDAVTYDGAVYCVGCLPEGVSLDSEEVTPIFASEEADTLPVCDKCGMEHDYVTLLESEEDWQNDAMDSAPTEERFSLVFTAYCGMRIVLHDHLDSYDVRDVAAQEIQRLRDLGHTVVTLEKGREWESEEPEDSVMVPDTAGVLSIEEG